MIVNIIQKNAVKLPIYSTTEDHTLQTEFKGAYCETGARGKNFTSRAVDVANIYLQHEIVTCVSDSAKLKEDSSHKHSITYWSKLLPFCFAEDGGETMQDLRDVRCKLAALQQFINTAPVIQLNIHRSFSSTNATLFIIQAKYLLQKHYFEL